jgi:hypothetical protein
MKLFLGNFLHPLAISSPLIKQMLLQKEKIKLPGEEIGII